MELFLEKKYIAKNRDRKENKKMLEMKVREIRFIYAM